MVERGDAGRQLRLVRRPPRGNGPAGPFAAPYLREAGRASIVEGCYETAPGLDPRQDGGMDSSMKAMKLYDRVERIHNELAQLEIDGDTPLTVDQLTPFDNYHYFGTEAVDEAIVTLGLEPGMRVLDVGSGIGGPARYIAEQS